MSNDTPRQLGMELLQDSHIDIGRIAFQGHFGIFGKSEVLPEMDQEIGQLIHR